MSPPLIALVGPTSTGKTRLAVALAHALRPAALVNADSRQLRRGLRVGTCAPTASELGDIPCHLLDLAEPGEGFTVADWLASAQVVLRELQQRAVRPIVVGGTGLYVTALVDGYDLGGVPPDAAVRAERTRVAATAAGLEQLAAELVRRDPSAADGVYTRNPRRVIRALEIVDAKGSLAGVRTSDPRPAVLIGLDVPRALHETWVQQRCDAMFRSGALLDETSAALARGHSPADLQACGIGYAEALAVLDGTLDRIDAVAAATRRTLRYAKAQRTYFRRDRRITWLDAGTSPPALLAAARDVVVTSEQAAKVS
jgi:tRNA dimethylallyltransferase